MRLSDQIELLRETLEELGCDRDTDVSVGESAADMLKTQDALLTGMRSQLEEAQYQETTQSDKDRIAQFVEENEVLREELMRACRNDVMAMPSTDGLCDSCQYLKDAALPRLCVNPEAWRQGFSRRGYSVKAGHGCELWGGR